MKAAVAFLALVSVTQAAQLPLRPNFDLNDDAHSAFDVLKELGKEAANLFSHTSAPNAKPKGFTASKLLKTTSEEVDGETRTFVTYSAGASLEENPLKAMSENTLKYELIQHEEFPQYSIRLRQPSICDPNVLQYSGYLDVAEDKHLFFWFFESRVRPAEAPLVLWLNGGPGCSSSTGLLFELGPCAIKNQGQSTEVNDYSWSSHSNMIFLDQPVNVGYSYSEGTTVNNTPDAAEDVYAFLQLFLGRFKKYSQLPFHVAAESYGGRYAPLIASAIHKHNKALSFLSESSLAPIPRVLPINLASVLIGNGLTEPQTQMGTVPDFACNGPYPVYDDPEGPQCQALRGKVPTCQRLVGSCYNSGSKFACVPAALYCNSQLFGPFQQLGLNPYDVRKKCNKAEDGDLCYREMGWIETFLNNATIKHELGVLSEDGRDVEFKSCNLDVNSAFLFQGDGMHNSAEVIPELLEDGIRFLIYAGNADFMCNFMGNEQWMLKLESKFKAEFNKAPLGPYRTLSGKVAGRVRAAGGEVKTAGNFTYVVVHEAGHMVPFDQPEAALDLFVRWITNTPLTS